MTKLRDDALILYPCSAGFSWSETRMLGVWADKYGAPIGECIVIPEMLDGGRDLALVGAAWVDF